MFTAFYRLLGLPERRRLAIESTIAFIDDGLRNSSLYPTIPVIAGHTPGFGRTRPDSGFSLALSRWWQGILTDQAIFKARDRRRALRYEMRIPVGVIEENGSTRAQMINVSRTGALIRMDETNLPLDIGRRLLLCFEKDVLPIERYAAERQYAIVRRLTSEHHIGVEFDLAA